MAEDAKFSQSWKLQIQGISLPSSLLPRHCRTQSLGHGEILKNHHVVATHCYHIIIPSFIVAVARKVGTFAGNAMFLMGALNGTGGTCSTRVAVGHWTPSKIRRHLTSHNNLLTTQQHIDLATPRCLRLQKVLYESKLAHDIRVDSGNPCAQQLLPAHGYIQCTSASVSFSKSREAFTLF